jgi:hypothetical protein
MIAKRIHCESCQNDHATTKYPGEFMRVVWGKAKLPDPKTRFMVIDSMGKHGTTREVFPMPTGYYICDLCGTPINPGDRCAAVSYGRTGSESEELTWEDEALERE